MNKPYGFYIVCLFIVSFLSALTWLYVYDHDRTNDSYLRYIESDILSGLVSILLLGVVYFCIGFMLK